LLVENSIFENCTKSGEPGSCIYTEGTKTNFILSKSLSIGNHLTTKSSGVFIYISLSSKESFNFVFFSSVSDTIQTDQSAWEVYLNKGIIRFISNNVSSNYCSCEPGFCLHSDSQSLEKEIYFSKEYSHVRYCSISDNFASGWNCITFSSNEHSIIQTNLVNNSQMRDDWGGIVRLGSVTSFTKCCFTRNGKLFHITDPGSATIKDCYMQSNYKDLVSGAFTEDGNIKEIDIEGECNYYTFIFGPYDIDKGRCHTCKQKTSLSKNSLFLNMILTN
jgi:hypothetical protein